MQDDEYVPEISSRDPMHSMVTRVNSIEKWRRGEVLNEIFALHARSHTHNGDYIGVVDTYISLTAGVFSQYIHVSEHQFVYLTHTHLLYVSNIP